MSAKYDTIYAARVSRVATGEDNNPDTYILRDKALIPIRTGIFLSLFTSGEHGYTNLGWVEVEKARVVGRDEVEFVIVRWRGEDDLLTGLRHFLVVKREWAAAGWSTKSLVARLATKLRSLTTSEVPIRRFLPPSPPPSPSLPPTPEPSNPPTASRTSSIIIDHRWSVEDPTVSPDGLQPSDGTTVEHVWLAAQEVLSMGEAPETSEDCEADARIGGALSLTRE